MSGSGYDGEPFDDYPSDDTLFGQFSKSLPPPPPLPPSNDNWSGRGWSLFMRMEGELRLIKEGAAPVGWTFEARMGRYGFLVGLDIRQGDLDEPAIDYGRQLIRSMIHRADLANRIGEIFAEAVMRGKKAPPLGLFDPAA